MSSLMLMHMIKQAKEAPLHTTHDRTHPPNKAQTKGVGGAGGAQPPAPATFDARWRDMPCNTADLLMHARMEARVAFANAPDHTVAECAQWRNMFRPSPLLVRTDLRDFPDVALFRYSHDAFALLSRCVHRANAKEVSPDVANRAFEFLRENRGAIEFIGAADLRTDGHEVLVYTADLSMTPRPASQGNIVTIIDRNNDLGRLRIICRAIRPARTAFVRILPHIRVPAQPWAGIRESAPLSFFHVHLVDPQTYTLGPHDIPL